MENEFDFFNIVRNLDLDGLREALTKNPAFVNARVKLSDNLCDNKGAHPLHRLCDVVFDKQINDEQAIEVAKVLLAFGADINGYRSQGDNNTPLIAAASLHAEQLGIFYIEQGADVFCCDNNDGATALHWASFCGRDLLVQKLIEVGANIDVSDKTYHSTPLGWGAHTLQNGAGNNLFHQAECIRLLLNAGARPDESTRRFLESIHIAVQ